MLNGEKKNRMKADTMLPESTTHAEWGEREQNETRQNVAGVTTHAEGVRREQNETRHYLTTI